MTDADVEDVVASWQEATEQGRVCGSVPDSTADVNGDGCIDVADIQAIASRISGSAATPASSSSPRSSTGTASTRSVSPSAQTTSASNPTFVVNATGDEADAVRNGVCATASGACTLRAAIQEANGQTVNTQISFAIPGSGPQTIQLGSRLNLLNNAGITIDGYTQSGAAPNTLPLTSNATINIQIVGNGYTATSIDGLLIGTSNNVIRGLSMYNFRRAVWITGAGAGGNQVLGNFLCTDAAGQFLATTTVPGSNGVVVQNGAHDNQIGASGAANRNVLSGCPHHGGVFNDGGTTRNSIQNNIIGLNPSATGALPNRSHGVDINSAVTDTTVGGTGSDEGNLVSGNRQEGVEISHGTQTYRNNVYGNRIGTDATGTRTYSWTANVRQGVRLEGAPTCDLCGDVGGQSIIANNVIAGNGFGGVEADKGRSDNVIRDNKIGLTSDGTPAGNTYYGVRIEHDAQRNVVGPGNEIAYNGAGIQFQSIGSEPDDPQSDPTNFNRITQNSIHDNTGVGIDLAPLFQSNAPGTGDPNTNMGIDYPVITSTTSTGVGGTTCPGCIVEVFEATGAAGGNGEGKTYLGSGTADGTGRFSVVASGSIAGKTVTATATDPQHNTSEFATNVAVSVTAPTTYATDTFTRTQSNGWGVADMGGSWYTPYGSDRFAVSGGVGQMLLHPGDYLRTYLTSVSQRDVSLETSIVLSQLPLATMNVTSAVRRVDAGTEYRARVQIYPNGTVGVTPARLVDNVLYLLGSEVIVPGVSATAGLRLRLAVSGASPTNVNVKLWQDGTSEPSAWTATATDSEPRLQVPGSVGVTSYLPAKGPALTASFDNLQAESF